MSQNNQEPTYPLTKEQIKIITYALTEEINRYFLPSTIKDKQLRLREELNDWLDTHQ